jgi:hypothetical protein
MSAQDLLLRLAKVKQTGPENWMACCPAHEDKSPSLTVRECSDGRVLLHCFAGCGVGDILGAVGLSFDAIFPPKPPTDPALKPIRRPYPAADVLEALAHESKYALVALAAMHRGEPVDRERLALAMERFERGRELANG